jgi:hypothetical protein
MAVTTAGFLRKCCPSEVLGATRLEEAAPPLLLDEASLLLLLPPPLAKEYGADEAAAAVGPDRRIRLFLGMMIAASVE